MESVLWHRGIRPCGTVHSPVYAVRLPTTLYAVLHHPARPPHPPLLMTPVPTMPCTQVPLCTRPLCGSALVHCATGLVHCPAPVSWPDTGILARHRPPGILIITLALAKSPKWWDSWPVVCQPGSGSRGAAPVTGLRRHRSARMVVNGPSTGFPLYTQWCVILACLAPTLPQSPCLLAVIGTKSSMYWLRMAITLLTLWHY